MLELLGALGVLAIIVLTASYIFKKKDQVGETEDVIIPDADCCGAHEVCESDLPVNINDKPVYFDDEELDRFKERTQNSYLPDEIEEFMEVFLTLQEKEVHDWLKSLHIRAIELPGEVREQALIVLGELRAKTL